MSFLNYITYRGRIIPTGLKGECVEFVRRWLIIHMGIFFENVDYAVDIWKLPAMMRISDRHLFPFHSIPNNGTYLPTVGSIIVYKKVHDKIPSGHVAVITHIDWKKRLVRIDERNWRGHDKTIRILKNGKLDDPYIIGWKTY